MSILEQLEQIKPATMLSLVPAAVYADVQGTQYEWAPVQHSWYYAVAKLFKPASILEIGVMHGQSLAAMLLGAGQCIGEGWDTEGYEPGSNAVAIFNLKLCGLENRSAIFKRDSQKETRLPAFDLIHVDGEHSYNGAMHDLLMAARSAKLILFDDIFHLPDCKRALADFMASPKVELLCEIPTQTGMALIKVK